MRFAHSLMRPLPRAQLLHDPGLASHGHPASPFAIYAQPERAATRERQVKQLDAKLLMSFKISNDHPVVRFRTGHAPSYLIKSNNARNESKSSVHGQMYSLVYNPGSNSR